MRNATPLTAPLLCACLLVLTPACSFIKQITGADGQEPKVTADTAGQEQKIIADTAKQAQANIALGEYKKALETYSGAYDRYHYPGMRGGYTRTAEQIKGAADAAYQKKDCAEAGNIYNTLYESGITTRDFAQSLSFDDDYLNGQISVCSKILLENGLMKYREEKLDEAIVIWKKALVFDPENTGIKNAMDTATLQLQKLKSLK
jgi:tetratricopeptide (TPR) repeat protein